MVGKGRLITFFSGPGLFSGGELLVLGRVYLHTSSTIKKVNIPVPWILWKGQTMWMENTFPRCFNSNLELAHDYRICRKVALKFKRMFFLNFEWNG